MQFLAGETTQTITVQVTGDAVDEPDESFSVSLSNVTNATIADGYALGTIFNDDATISMTYATVVEGDQSYAFLDAFVPAGTGGLATSRGIEFGPDGNQYVTRATDAAVLRFDGETGASLGVFAADPQMFQNRDLEFGPDGNLFVSDNNGDRVLRFDGTSGALIDVFVTPGAAGLDAPRGLIFGPDGSGDGHPDLYVTSGDTNEILRFDGQTGAFVDTFVAAGSGGLVAPTTLKFGPDGHLYVASGANVELNNSILRYDGTTGAFIDAFVPVGSAGLTLVPTAGMFFGPDRSGDGESDLYLSNGRVHEILVFDGVSGAPVETLVPSGSGGLDDPKGITLGGDGNLYVVSNGNNAVLQYGVASQAVFTVSLSTASSLPVTVDFNTSDGTALAGSDYASTIGTIVFNPGVTERTIVVPTIDDSDLEPTENFTLDLSNAVGATIADAEGLGEIVDNEVPNAPPTVDAGADLILNDADGTGSESVTLVGSASDPDGSVVATKWRNGATVLGTSPELSTTLPVGVHTLTFSATDNEGATSSDSVVVTVLANQGPSADAGSDVTVYDNDESGSETVSLVGSGSDADGSIVSYEWRSGSTVLGNTASISPNLPVGTHELTLTVTDNGGATASDTITVTIEEPAATNAIYVYDIRFESTWGGRLRRAVFEIRSDSNGDGQGSAADDVAAGVEITVEFAGQTYTGTTDSNGVFRTGWLWSPSSGSYAEVVDLVFADHSWDALLMDLEDDSDGDGLPDAVL